VAVVGELRSLERDLRVQEAKRHVGVGKVPHKRVDGALRQVPREHHDVVVALRRHVLDDGLDGHRGIRNEVLVARKQDDHVVEGEAHLLDGAREPGEHAGFRR
jgi:hypothetical protein